MSSIEYIRKQYNVPAKRGGRITYQGQPATIVGSRNTYLVIKIDGEDKTKTIHPTWEVVYMEVK